MSEDTLRRDTNLGTEAGIRVLAELAERFNARADDVNSYQDAIEELSGLGAASMRSRYAAEVYAVLKTGGAFAARGNEVVRIELRPDVEIPPIREDSLGRSSGLPGSDLDSNQLRWEMHLWPTRRHRCG